MRLAHRRRLAHRELADRTHHLGDPFAPAPRVAPAPAAAESRAPARRSGSSMWRKRQRRFSASESSRVLFDVSTTNGRVARRDRAELGDGHLEGIEHLEQQRLGLDLDPVDLVDEQHDRLRADVIASSSGRVSRKSSVKMSPSSSSQRLALVGSGSAAAACGSSTRTAPSPRRALRSTAAGPAAARSPLRWPVPSAVLPTPAGPSARIGFVEPVGEKHDLGDAVVGQIAERELSSAWSTSAASVLPRCHPRGTLRQRLGFARSASQQSWADLRPMSGSSWVTRLRIGVHRVAREHAAAAEEAAELPVREPQFGLVRGRIGRRPSG